MRKAAIALAVASLALVFAPQAAAALRVNVDVLWNPNPANDTQVFLHLSNTAFPQPRERVVAVFHEIPDPFDDFPVLAFIAFHGHVDIGTVWAYKRKGHSWYNVMARFGVSPAVLFVELPRPPGPPYGKAYGHWRKHRRIGPDALTNEDIRYWVKVHALSRTLGLQPAAVVDLHGGGQRFENIAGSRFRDKHGKGGKPQEAGFGAPGPGSRGKAHGHDKNKHHEND